MSQSLLIPVVASESTETYVHSTYDYEGVLVSSYSDKNHTVKLCWSLDGDNFDHIESHAVLANTAFYNTSHNRGLFFKLVVENDEATDMTFLRAHFRMGNTFNETDLTLNVKATLETVSSSVHSGDLADTNFTSSMNVDSLKNITIMGNVTTAGSVLELHESVDNSTFYRSNDSFILDNGSDFHFETEVNTKFIKFKADGDFTGLNIIVSGKE